MDTDKRAERARKAAGSGLWCSDPALQAATEWRPSAFRGGWCTHQYTSVAKKVPPCGPVLEVDIVDVGH